MVLPCGHTVCKFCFTSIERRAINKVCPVCRTDLSQGRVVENFTLRAIVGRLRGRCRRCAEMESVSYLLDHESMCPEVEIGCPNLGCDTRVLRKNALAHQRICPEEILHCECGQDVTRRLMSSHTTETCSIAQVACAFQCKNRDGTDVLMKR